jgi:hypothetical protein
LWSQDADVLLVPRGLSPRPSTAIPDDTTLAAWLHVLDPIIAAADADAIRALLDAVRDLLKPLAPDRRGRWEAAGVSEIAAATLVGELSRTYLGALSPADLAPALLQHPA